MHAEVHQKTRRSMRRTLVGGTAVACLLAFGIGGWAATTELAGAVIAPGSLVVDTNVKKVQHPTGGGVGELWSKNLIPITRVTALERDAARLEGERGSLVSTIAQTKGKMTETELQILQIDQDLRTEVGKDLAEIRAKTSELVEKKVAAEDQLKRIDIR